MYDVLEVIYGIPYTAKIAEAVRDYGEWGAKNPNAKDNPFNGSEPPGEVEYDELDKYGFDFSYTGHVVDITPGYLGVQLAAYEPADKMTKPFPTLTPTEAQRVEVAAMYEKCPDWLRTALEEPGVHLIWSTS